MGSIAMHRTLYSSVPMQVYMTKAVKEPLMDSVNLFFKPNSNLTEKRAAINWFRKAVRNIAKIPEPTLENTWHPNTHNLIRLNNSLKRHWLVGWIFRLEAVRQLVKFGIIVYDFDPPWRWIIDSVKDRLLAGTWTLRNLTETRDWLCSCLSLNETRMKFIRRVMDLAIFFYFTPARWLMDYVKAKAAKMEWKPRGFEDNWTQSYTWWKE